MKTTIGLATLAALVALAMCDYKTDFERFNKMCLDETRVTEAEMKQYVSNGMTAADTKENIKCHMKCVLEKQGIMQGGKYNEEVAIKKIKEIPELKDHYAEIEKSIQSCKNEKGTNDCDTAYKITMCMKEQKSQVMA